MSFWDRCPPDCNAHSKAEHQAFDNIVRCTQGKRTPGEQIHLHLFCKNGWCSAFGEDVKTLPRWTKAQKELLRQFFGEVPKQLFIHHSKILEDALRTPDIPYTEAKIIRNILDKMWPDD